MLATGRDGFLDNGPDHGLFVHPTRLLSRYRYSIKGRPPGTSATRNTRSRRLSGRQFAAGVVGNHRLGLQPFAPLRLLFIDPNLPAWLPEMTISNLRVANATVTIRFFRKAHGRSDYEALDRRSWLL